MVCVVVFVRLIVRFVFLACVCSVCFFGELCCRCLLFVCVVLFCVISVGLYVNGVVYVCVVALVCCCVGLLCVVVVVVCVCFVCGFLNTCAIFFPKQCFSVACAVCVLCAACVLLLLLCLFVLCVLSFKTNMCSILSLAKF